MAAVITETLTLPDLPPLVGVTESHAPPEADALKLLATPPIASVCDAGGVLPIWKAKVSEEGVTVRVGGAGVTVKVTGTVFGLPVEPGAVMVTDPL